MGITEKKRAQYAKSVLLCSSFAVTQRNNHSTEKNSGHIPGLQKIKIFTNPRNITEKSDLLHTLIFLVNLS
jgi:hypothetical protein